MGGHNGENKRIECPSCGAEVDHWRWSCTNCGSQVEPQIGFAPLPEEVEEEGKDAGEREEPSEPTGVRKEEMGLFDRELLHRRLRRSLLIRIAITVLIVAVLLTAVLLLARARRGRDESPVPSAPTSVLMRATAEAIEVEEEPGYGAVRGGNPKEVLPRLRASDGAA